MVRRFMVSELCLLLIASSVLAAESGEWGSPNQGGLKTRLVPLESQYALGKPLRLRLEMTNAGPSAVSYDALEHAVLDDSRIIRLAKDLSPGAQVAFTDSLSVKGPDGQQAPFVAHVSSNTVSGKASVDPGEVVVLCPEFDVASLYYFEKAGRYLLQFKGKEGLYSRIPPSNILEIDIQEGPRSPLEQLVGRLLKTLPGDWKIAQRTPPTRTQPIGREEAEGAYIALAYSPAGGLGAGQEGLFIRIWQMERPVRESQLTAIFIPEASSHGEDILGVSDAGLFDSLAEYLGQSPGGHVYVLIPPKAEQVWPQAKEQIATALEIHRE